MDSLRKHKLISVRIIYLLLRIDPAKGINKRCISYDQNIFVAPPIWGSGPTYPTFPSANSSCWFRVSSRNEPDIGVSELASDTRRRGAQWWTPLNWNKKFAVRNLILCMLPFPHYRYLMFKFSVPNDTYTNIYLNKILTTATFRKKTFLDNFFAKNIESLSQSVLVYFYWQFYHV